MLALVRTEAVDWQLSGVGELNAVDHKMPMVGLLAEHDGVLWSRSGDRYAAGEVRPQARPTASASQPSFQLRSESTPTGQARRQRRPGADFIVREAGLSRTGYCSPAAWCGDLPGKVPRNGRRRSRATAFHRDARAASPESGRETESRTQTPPRSSSAPQPVYAIHDVVGCRQRCWSAALASHMPSRATSDRRRDVNRRVKALGAPVRGCLQIYTTQVIRAGR